MLFQYQQSGKPVLADSYCSSLSFNLSHSGQWAIIAVANGSQVGVDIEFIEASLEYKQVMEHYFDTSEREFLSHCPAMRQRREFYRLWTQKEAVLKMTGSGFNQPEDIVKENSVYLENFFLAPGYVAAVATDRQVLSIFRFTFPVCHSVLSLNDKLVN